MNGTLQDSKPTLLLVTNDPPQLLTLSEFLNHEYQVLTATSSEAGFNTLLDNRGKIQVLITEFNMFKKTGLDLLTKANQRFSSLPIIVLNYLSSAKLNEQSMDRTAITYLHEPVKHNQLRQRIVETIQQREQREIQPLKVVDLVPLYCVSQAKVALTVVRKTTDGEERGKIYFEEGKITNAIYAKRRGVEALYALMGWETGKFFTRYQIVAKHKTIQQDWESLLREAEQWLQKHVATQKTAVSAAPAESAKPETLFPSQIQNSIKKILDELYRESEDLVQAIVVDAAGNILSGTSASLPTVSSTLSKVMTDIMEFHQQADQVLDAGPFDEATLLSEKNVFVLYPIPHVGILGVITRKEQQGMIRWNCRDAIGKIKKLM